ncbi:hypothetical protein So717_16370 [Roseobacter cerasinus]|uniref:Hemolysin XhlA n=1 Tax=Roseobacter cerasinus TaxID=2602289 RepID=A0A640VQJ7_9RHOB|nr:hypothetical protein [Roseobacter cerasinus]GFE49884.1 hypothetical protein So717_16370 [Roseobacter cerasinus]
MSSAEKKSFNQHVIYPFDDFENVFQRIDQRMTAIERATVLLERELAVAEEKRKFVEQRFNQVDTRLDRIDGHISRLVWLIIATIVGGLMSFIMRGAMFGP